MQKLQYIYVYMYHIYRFLETQEDARAKGAKRL